MNNQIGEAGGIKNSSRSTSATNFYPNTFRLLYFECYSLLLTMGLFFVIGAAAVGVGIFFWPAWPFLTVIFLILAVLVLKPFLRMGYSFLRIFKHTRINFKNGLLTAAIVTDASKKQLLHIAVLSFGGNPSRYVYGILMREYDAFPGVWLKNGQRLACVSTFMDDGPYFDTWTSFLPLPVIFGTTNPDRIARCLEVVEKPTGEAGSYFDILNRFLYLYEAPEKPDGLIVCDKDGIFIESRSKDGTEISSPPIPRRTF